MISVSFHSRLHSIALSPLTAAAQVGHIATEIAQYTELHAAAQKSDVSQIKKLAALNARDSNVRTPLLLVKLRGFREMEQIL